VALAWGIVAAAVLLLAGLWLDVLWEMPPPWRIALVWLAAAASVAALAFLLWQTSRQARPAVLARRLDRAAGSGGEILTGLDLWQTVRGGSSSALTLGLSQIAVDHAASLAAQAPLARAIPARPLGRALAVVAGGSLLLALVYAAAPGLLSTEWQRFARPWDDVPPHSPLRFTVTPGNAEVLYGGELEIVALVEGGAVDRLDLVLQSPAGGPSRLPMFSDADGRWRALLSKVTEPTEYFVQAYRARSRRFRIDVVEVPQLESVRARISPPEYAGQPPLEGPVLAEGIKGLRGTQVTLWATSNRPLAGGTLVLTASEPKPGTPRGKPQTVAMRPAEPGAAEVAGEFEIQGDGRLECRVTDEAGRASPQSFSANITLVADQHPLVRIIEPQPQSMATPTADLPVVLSAEDDCGIERLELFRSLNDSRSRPAQVKLPKKWPRRADPQVVLPLARYGLAPGDAIKLFARVEDNDPAGSKGAESRVVSVRIISQADFERMLQMRQGIEVLASKYHDAMRRVEELGQQVDELRKKLEKQPDGPLAEEIRKELHRLQQQMQRESEAIARLAGNRLPFDLDAALAPELAKLSRMTDEMAKELEKLEKDRSLLKKDLAKSLAGMADRLDEGRRKYQQEALEPVEYLEAVFPLLVDQERFVVLVLRQKDLAERMAGLKGHDNEDNSALRARMRDLESEQQEIRTALDSLLDDIQDHATRLPEKPELEKLRETALQFMQDVRASPAGPAMQSAENALGEFQGTRAYASAQEAAEILERFLKRCQGGMGKACHGALVFQPKLCSGMGNTVEQLLAAMGAGSGSGGMGAFGLYGSMAGLSGLGGQFGDAHQGATGIGRGAGPGSGGGENPEFLPADDQATNQAAAAGDAQVPLRYRRHVGQYFQRLAEELDDPRQPQSHRRGK
jgi:hypothetical protein